MKTTLSLEYNADSDSFLICDISLELAILLDFDENKLNELKGKDLTISYLTSYLRLIKQSNISFLEFFYRIKKTLYQIKILKKDDSFFIVFFENIDLHKFYEMPNLEIQSLDDKRLTSEFHKDYTKVIKEDQDLVELLNAKAKDKETIDLEILFLMRKLKDDLEQIKTEIKSIHQETNRQIDNIESTFLRKVDFNLVYLVAQTGIKKIFFFLLFISLIETMLFEPLLQPLMKNIGHQIEKIIELD
jgi:hypothetical protein